MVRAEQCCLLVFIVILFTTNVNTARLPDRSPGPSSQLLGTKSRKPLIVIVKTDAGYNQHKGQRTSDDNSISQDRYPDIEIEARFVYRDQQGDRPTKQLALQNVLNKILRLLQMKNHPIIQKLKGQFELLKSKFKKSLRYKCSPIDSCEESPKDSCEESDECVSANECDETDDECEPKKKPKKHRQKTNREVYEYLKKNPPYKNVPKRPNKNKYEDNVSTSVTRTST